MIKGQVISGKIGEIAVRQKSGEEIELGELLIAKTKTEKILLQAYDLLYGSQVSQQNLELISGMMLEENTDVEFMDPNIRNYTIAMLKSLISIKNENSKNTKTLPSFFSEVHEVTKEDLNFLTKPKNPLFVGNLRSGSKVLDVDIFLPGDEVFSHHILIPATTGRGKSLDENEEVIIQKDNVLYLKSIGEIVENSSNFIGSKALSMNPKNYSTDFKDITHFVKHKAPHFMYHVITESGREVMVTGDHNLYVLNNGRLTLLKTEQVSSNDYIPLPLKIDCKNEITHINLLNLLKNEKNIFVNYHPNLLKNLKTKSECLKILKKYSRPIQKYNDFIIKNNRIEINIFSELLKFELSDEEINFVKLTDIQNNLIIDAQFKITKEFLQLLGYYISEGYSLNDNSFRISSSEKQVQEHLKGILKNIGLKYFMIKKNGKDMDIGISSSIFTKIIKACNVGRVSGEKRLPNFFMSLSDENLSSLLKTYYEGDGGVDLQKIDVKKRFKISATTKSKKLASDLCFALLRFGIVGRCKKRFQKATNTNHKGDTYFRVAISGRDEIKEFFNKLGFQFERKNDILKDKLDYEGNTNVDLIPINPKDFLERRIQTNLSQKQFSKKLNCSQQIISRIEKGERRPSRKLFTKIISTYKEFSDCSNLLNFKWDKVENIKKIRYKKKYVYDLTIKDNKTFLAGHGGLFVHNSNLTSCMLWDAVDKDYCGILVLDPHDEYYGKNKFGLKDHPKKENVVYYTPKNAPARTRTLSINIENIKPWHFNGVVEWTIAQVEALNAYFKRYGPKWIESIVIEKPVDGFGDATLSVLRRRLLQILDLQYKENSLTSLGVFKLNSGESTITDICADLEKGRIVIIDTSNFSGNVEILIGSLITTEIFEKYKYYKIKGELDNKPVISIILEEAPRVLGKEVLEKGSNIFATIAREGRKFKVGLTAITQLPSLIPRQILANMNTKIILGIEMAPERQAIIESSAQDLSQDSRAIASLDKGEAIISSNFSKFAMPVKIPLFEKYAKKSLNTQKQKVNFEGVKL